jgi:hypothetical protein
MLLCSIFNLRLRHETTHTLNIDHRTLKIEYFYTEALYAILCEQHVLAKPKPTTVAVFRLVYHWSYNGSVDPNLFPPGKIYIQA